MNHYIVFVLADEVARFNTEDAARQFALIKAEAILHKCHSFSTKRTYTPITETLHIETVFVTGINPETGKREDTCVYYQIIEE